MKYGHIGGQMLVAWSQQRYRTRLVASVRKELPSLNRYLAESRARVVFAGVQLLLERGFE